ncbi:hypothetical protein FANTH_14680 [Fusarium anthophilum]|uniref:Endopolygalacturonase n=1 Tax=Fusarium anthophilum TaxID=48485 RepID=A0A8H4YGU2_9HYPO|nr:hypothetical protein FANTH_14680 [Fusarium anthophilum]
MTNSLAVTKAPNVEKPAICTFRGTHGATEASPSKFNCGTIVIRDTVVSSGHPLDLPDLNDNAHVVFHGRTTWDYAEWKGPLLHISGNNIVVNGAGTTFDAQGSRWWDGKGIAGSFKPKFIFHHGWTTSNFNNIYILNTPLIAVSIANRKGLNINSMTINNSAGDRFGGHNTDRFDVSNSSALGVITIHQNYEGNLKGTPMSDVRNTDLSINNIIGGNVVSLNVFSIVITCGSTGCSL